MTLDLRAIGRSVVAKEAAGLMALADSLGDQFVRAVEVIYRIPGKVVCTGVGKSGLVARKVAASMASMGTPAIFVHPADAAHGDLGMIECTDAVLAFSRSGHAAEILPVLEHAAANRIPRFLVTERRDSRLGTQPGVACLVIPETAEGWWLAPTSSTTAQIALGDALAVCLAERRGFTPEKFKALHPGGALGRYPG